MDTIRCVLYSYCPVKPAAMRSQKKQYNGYNSALKLHGNRSQLL